MSINNDNIERVVVRALAGVLADKVLQYLFAKERRGILDLGNVQTKEEVAILITNLLAQHITVSDK